MTQSVEQLKSELARIAETMQRQQFHFDLDNVLNMMISSFPLFEEPVQNLSRMLCQSVNHDSSSVSILMPLEMMLCAPNSVLYNR